MSSPQGSPARKPRQSQRNSTLLAVSAGVLFGLLFPFVGTLVEGVRVGVQTPAAALSLHRTTPLLWIIDLAPLVLGLAGYVYGVREALLVRLRSAEAQMARQNRALHESEERFRGLVEVMSDWIWETDLHGRYVHVGGQVAENMGFASAEVIGRTPFDLMTPAEAERVREISAGIVAAGERFDSLECEMRTKHGRTVFMEVSGVPLYDATGRLTGYRGVNRDITRRKEAERERELYQSRLEELAALDPLTGLANRRIFIRRLEDAWDRDPDAPLSLILLDADHFKAYNDEFGHLEGDRALLRIAGALAANARPQDTVARYGGEEFVVLLPDADVAQACALAERLRDAVASEEWLLRQTTASFGVAERAPEMRRSAELISAADRALYAAKANGRNRVQGGHAANDCFASGGRPRV